MLGFKDRIHHALLKLYGESEESVDSRVREQKQRVEKRRGERTRAGMGAHSRRRHTAEEYADWMNLDISDD